MSSGPSGESTVGDGFRQHSGGSGCCARCKTTIARNWSLNDEETLRASTGRIKDNASNVLGSDGKEVIPPTYEEASSVGIGKL